MINYRQVLLSSILAGPLLFSGPALADNFFYHYLIPGLSGLGLKGENFTVTGNKITGTIRTVTPTVEGLTATGIFFRCSGSKTISEIITSGDKGSYMLGSYYFLDKKAAWEGGKSSAVTLLSWSPTESSLSPVMYNDTNKYALLQILHFLGNVGGWPVASSNSCAVGSSTGFLTTGVQSRGLPTMKLSIDIPSDLIITAGQYIITLKVNAGSLQGRSDSKNLPIPTISEMNSLGSTLININVPVEITNKCTLSTEVMNLSHGSISIASANNNEVSKSVSMRCDYNASFKYKLVSSGATNTAEYATVDLGNNWNSELSVRNGTTRTSSGAMSTTNNVADITVVSKLQQGAGSTAGLLNGSAVLNIEID